MIRKSSLTIGAALLLATVKLNAQIPSGYEAGLEKIKKESIVKHVEFLASDSLKGRAAGTEENLIAGLYIAKEFREAGLAPLKYIELKKKYRDEDFQRQLSVENAGVYDEYLQKFNLQKVELAQNNTLQLFKSGPVSDLKIEYKYNKDFFINYDGADDICLKAPLVFAGYGIVSKEKNYNDYLTSEGKEINVKDKIVILIDSYPGAASFSGDRNKLPIEVRNIKPKAELAMRNGAAAVFVVQSPLLNEDPVSEKYKKNLDIYEKEHFKLHDQYSNSFPVFYLTNKIASEIFRKIYGTDLREILEAMEKAGKPNAKELGCEAAFSINTSIEIIPVQNVVGWLEGSDPVLKNEYVVVCGHYDHVGLGFYGSLDKANAGKIHNGADDNASGTAGVIEIAKAFSAVKPKRSIVFIGYNAEENGILGSKYYVNFQPFKPIEKTVACVNLDMIGRNSEKYVYLGGSFQGRDIINTVKQANEKIGFELMYNVGLYSKASDQGPFLNKKIPSVFFFAGDHDDYHTPSDDIEKLNFDKIGKITRLAYLSVWCLANQPVNPVYQELTLKEREELIKDSQTRMKKLNLK